MELSRRQVAVARKAEQQIGLQARATTNKNCQITPQKTLISAAMDTCGRTIHFFTDPDGISNAGRGPPELCVDIESDRGTDRRGREQSSNQASRRQRRRRDDMNPFAAMCTEYKNGEMNVFPRIWLCDIVWRGEYTSGGYAWRGPRGETLM